MSKFQGYAQGGKFDPIKMPDESQKILQQTEQTVRGMQAVRNAEIENTAGYLKSLNSNIESEKAAYENASGMMRLNAQSRIDNAKIIQQEDAQRKKLAGEKSEAIWKGLAEFSGKAAEVYADNRQRKYDNDYDEELIRLYHTGGTPKDQQEILTDQFNYRNLQQMDVMTAGGARAAELAGADPGDVADMRQRIQSPSLGAKHARADFAAAGYGTYLTKAFAEDGETKVKLYNPNGEGFIDGTPNQARSSKDIALVEQQLLVKYLKENGMYGLKPAFLVNHLKKMRGESNKIISASYENEIKLQRQTQLNDIIEHMRSSDGTAPHRFHQAFELGKFLHPEGVVGMRNMLLKELETTKQNINGREFGFSDEAYQQIMDSSFPDQPNKTLGERFPGDFARITNIRQNAVTERFDAEQNANDHAIDVWHKQLKDILNQDINDGDNKLDLSLKNIELQQEQIQKLALENPKWNEVNRTLEAYKDFTEKGAVIKERREQLEKLIKNGMIKPEDVFVKYPEIPLDEKREYSKQAEQSIKSAPNKKVREDAEKEIENLLKGRMRQGMSISVGEGTNLSYHVIKAEALRRYHTTYQDELNDSGSHAIAAKNAIFEFRKEFSNETTGTYSLEQGATNPQTLGQFQHYKKFNKRIDYSTSINGIREQLDNNSNNINEKMISLESAKSAGIALDTRGRIINLNPQIFFIRDYVKKQGGGHYSYADILLKQLDAHGLLNDERKAVLKKAVEVENAIPERYSFLKNYPSATNTDVMLMSAGSEPVYNTNYNISATQRAGLDVLGKYESDGVGGYNAVNQVGINEGKGVLPGSFSGPFQNMPQHRGKLLTDLTVAEIMELQSGQRSSMSNDEWIRRGKLHAVGRYQFISDTFKAEVKRQGIDVNRKFSPELQDYMALNYLRISDITRWVGPSERASLKEKALVAAARTEPVSYGTSVWQQSRNMNPNLLARLPGNS